MKYDVVLKKQTLHCPLLTTSTFQVSALLHKAFQLLPNSLELLFWIGSNELTYLYIFLKLHQLLPNSLEAATWDRGDYKPILLLEVSSAASQ